MEKKKKTNKKTINVKAPPKPKPAPKNVLIHEGSQKITRKRD